MNLERVQRKKRGGGRDERGGGSGVDGKLNDKCNTKMMEGEKKQGPGLLHCRCPEMSKKGERIHFREGFELASVGGVSYRTNRREWR